MLQVGVVGCGYWGPNLIRNLNQYPRSTVRVCSDLSEKRLEHMKHLYPSIRTTTDAREVFADPEVQAVAIATPVFSHYRLAREALESGKHVFVEKPITNNSRQAAELVEIARAHGRILMVGHTFEYSAAVNKVREIIADGVLGEILYVRTTRVNLGLFQKDINVIWDLAPHDLSMLLYVLGRTPTHVTACGKAHVTEGIEDVAMLTLDFEGSLIAYVTNSWLDPNKIRKTTVVGDQKMLVFDDLEPTEKIRIYDKGVEKPRYYDGFGDFAYSYRYGDIVIPMLEQVEPLRTEMSHFLDSIESGDPPRSDGRSGERVVRILEAANRSLKNDGQRVPIGIDAAGDRP